jgi:hypothetical protein
MADGTAPQCGRVGSCHILLKALTIVGAFFICTAASDWVALPTSGWDKIPTFGWDKIPTFGWDKLPTSGWDKLPSFGWDKDILLKALTKVGLFLFTQ